MIFTDADLVRLKERISHNNLEVYGDKIDALLARLEAAEAVIPWTFCQCSGKACRCGYWEKKKAWRKAAGKS